MPSSVCIGVNSPADVVSWDPARCLWLPHLIALDQDSTEDLDDLGHGDDLPRTMILVRILTILVILIVSNSEDPEDGGEDLDDHGHRDGDSDDHEDDGEGGEPWNWCNVKQPCSREGVNFDNQYLTLGE